jgi:serine protease Do
VKLQAMGARDDEESASASQGKPRWGLGLADLTPDVRDQIQAPADVKGAVVERVQPGSSADDAGLRSGDIITEVNRHPVQSAADVQQQLGSVPKGKDAMVLVWSNGGSTFRVLHSPEGA